MTRRSTRWLLVAGIAVTGAALIVVMIVTAREVVLVDQVPGADAGIATSPELEYWRASVKVSGFAVLLLALLTLIPLVALLRRRLPSAGPER